jgi:flagellin
MRIQHNIMSMNAYRNYNTNTSALSGNLEKLSSGYKINRAGDDAAGLAISEKMRAQISGLEQASSNVKDGISLVKTAEGAMQEVQDMLNRMVTLATQSANGTYDESVDRDNLQKEVDQLTTEINRIADSANFNGIKLLDGSMDGSQAASTKTMDLSSALKDVVARTDSTDEASAIFKVSLNGYSGKAATTVAANATVATLTVGGETLDIQVKAQVTKDTAITFGDMTLADTSITIDNVVYDLGLSGDTITFTAETAPTSAGDILQTRTVSIAADTSKFAEDGGAKIDGAIQYVQEARVKGAGGEATANLTLSKDMVADGATFKIGNSTFTIDTSTVYDPTSTGTTIGVKGLLDEKGNITDENLAKVAARITNAATSNDQFTIGASGKTLYIQSKDTTSNTGAVSGTTKLDLSTAAKVKEQISVTTPVAAGKSLSLQIGDTSDSYNQLAVSIQDIHASTLGISTISIKTQDDAQKAIDSIKTAINTVSSVRGTLGATQNRLEHTSNNLSVMTENIQDAESTIRDTDVAEEMMAYTKNNILVQSAQAMLAQANSVPQGVLQLLQ